MAGRDPAAGVDVVAEFHKLYYAAAATGGTWKNTYWLGVPTWKCPLDLWVYQEIIRELRPDLIVESGTAYGGSALYLACICDLVGQGRIATIDTQTEPNRPRHRRISYLHGSSLSEPILRRVRAMSRGKKVMVLLDSDHSEAHVLNEMLAYAPLVSPGSYLIVEDTNINGHPVYPEFGPGPMEAVSAFLASSADFEVDAAREKFFMTFNPRGYLRRVR